MSSLKPLDATDLYSIDLPGENQQSTPAVESSVHLASSVCGGAGFTLPPATSTSDGINASANILESDNGDLPPMCNTGGNSPNRAEVASIANNNGDNYLKANYGSNAKIDIGWLKIRHTKASYKVWSYYRVLYKLGDGAEDCKAGFQHRLFGAKMPWGGMEYWGWPFRQSDSVSIEALEDLGRSWAPWMLRLTDTEIAACRAQGMEIGWLEDAEEIPELDLTSRMTEWSDDALHYIDNVLRQSGSSVVHLLSEMLDKGAKVTRLDLSADFGGTTIEPVIKSMEQRDYSPMKIHKLIDSRGTPMGGRTCYFGQRGSEGSGCYVRFYEKGKEQGLPIDILRFEIELSSDKAQEAAMLLTGEAEQWEKVGASIMAGAIDFREGYGASRGQSHASRDCERSIWFASLVTRLGESVKLRAVWKPDPTFETTKLWIETAVARPIAMMQAVMGNKRFNEWFGQIQRDGADKLSDRDLYLIRAASLCDVPF